MFLSRFPLTFLQTQKGDAPFHCTAYDYSHADWDGLRGHLKHVPWGDSFELGVSAVITEFCESSLELMYVSVIVIARLGLIYFHGFQLLVLLS